MRWMILKFVSSREEVIRWILSKYSATIGAGKSDRKREGGWIAFNFVYYREGAVPGRKGVGGVSSPKGECHLYANIGGSPNFLYLFHLS